MLKIIILVLLFAIILSLTSAGVYFFRDQGETRRTMIMLGIRVTLAVLLMVCVTWGVLSGELALNAPWHNV